MTEDKSLERYLHTLHMRKGKLDKEREDLAQTIEQTEAVLEAYAHWQAQEPSPDSAAEPGRDDSGVTAQDIAHCHTQREALYRVAVSKGGKVNIREAAKLILAAGLSGGKVASINATLHRIVSQSDDWEYVEPGVFKLVS